MHLDLYKDKGNVTIEMFIRNIVSQRPDLVVLAGDNITSPLNENWGQVPILRDKGRGR